MADIDFTHANCIIIRPTQGRHYAEEKTFFIHLANMNLPQRMGYMYRLFSFFHELFPDFVAPLRPTFVARKYPADADDDVDFELELLIFCGSGMNLSASENSIRPAPVHVDNFVEYVTKYPLGQVRFPVPEFERGGLGVVTPSDHALWANSLMSLTEFVMERGIGNCFFVPKVLFQKPNSLLSSLDIWLILTRDLVLVVVPGFSPSTLQRDIEMLSEQFLEQEASEDQDYGTYNGSLFVESIDASSEVQSSEEHEEDDSPEFELEQVIPNWGTSQVKEAQSISSSASAEPTASGVSAPSEPEQPKKSSKKKSRGRKSPYPKGTVGDLYANHPYGDVLTKQGLLFAFKDFDNLVKVVKRLKPYESNLYHSEGHYYLHIPSVMYLLMQEVNRMTALVMEYNGNFARRTPVYLESYGKLITQGDAIAQLQKYF